MPKVVPDYKENAKIRITQAAFKVFAQKGYHATIMKDIAEELGVSKGAIYQYFNNKEGILKEIIISYQQNARDILKKSFQKNQPFEALQNYHKTMTETYQANIAIILELISIAASDENIRNIVREEYEKDIVLLQTYIEQQQEKGKIKQDVNANLTSQVFIALYMGMTSKLIMGFSKSEVQKVWAQAIELILQK
jgi:AcrR family transcriptional regulator